jgi:uncharacterized protein YndB with AHSA1/START domain
MTPASHDMETIATQPPTGAAPASAERELVITRVFNAPRELVFAAWTDPRHLMSWWGPRDYPVTQMKMDLRPGGVWRGCLRSNADGRELWQGGVFREVVEPERVVFTFAWEEEGERGLETLVTVTFAEQDGMTRMTFHQAPFQSVEERDGHQGGWTSSFDRLVEYLPKA